MEMGRDLVVKKKVEKEKEKSAYSVRHHKKTGTKENFAILGANRYLNCVRVKPVLRKKIWIFFGFFGFLTFSKGSFPKKKSEK